MKFFYIGICVMLICCLWMAAFEVEGTFTQFFTEKVETVADASEDLVGFLKDYWIQGDIPDDFDHVVDPDLKTLLTNVSPENQIVYHGRKNLLYRSWRLFGLPMGETTRYIVVTSLRTNSMLDFYWVHSFHDVGYTWNGWDVYDANYTEPFLRLQNDSELPFDPACVIDISQDGYND